MDTIMLDNAALDILFHKARSHNGWLDTPVTEQDDFNQSPAPTTLTGAAA